MAWYASYHKDKFGPHTQDENSSLLAAQTLLISMMRPVFYLLTFMEPHLSHYSSLLHIQSSTISHHFHCYYPGPNHHHFWPGLLHWPPTDFPPSAFIHVQSILNRATRVILALLSSKPSCDFSSHTEYSQSPYNSLQGTPAVWTPLFLWPHLRLLFHWFTPLKPSWPLCYSSDAPGIVQM